jgi:hypothetical protein
MFELSTWCFVMFCERGRIRTRLANSQNPQVLQLDDLGNGPIDDDRVPSPGSVGFELV